MAGFAAAVGAILWSSLGPSPDATPGVASESSAAGQPPLPGARGAVAHPIASILATAPAPPDTIDQADPGSGPRSLVPGSARPALSHAQGPALTVLLDSANSDPLTEIGDPLDVFDEAVSDRLSEPAEPLEIGEPLDAEGDSSDQEAITEVVELGEPLEPEAPGSLAESPPESPWLNDNPELSQDVGPPIDADADPPPQVGPQPAAIDIGPPLTADDP